MLSAQVICCKYFPILWTNVSKGVNSVDPYQSKSLLSTGSTQEDPSQYN